MFATPGGRSDGPTRATKVSAGFRPGDILYMDMYNVAYLGYKICVCLTLSYGEASIEAPPIR